MLSSFPQCTQTYQMIKNCTECNKEFKTFPSRVGRFCSYRCNGLWHAKQKPVGVKSDGTRTPMSQEAREKQGKTLSKQYMGEGNPNWKGDDVGRAVHDWVVRARGPASKYSCQHKCGKMGRDWANVDHRYKRNLDDFIPMCRSCHMKYDFKLGFRKKQPLDNE